MIAAARVEIEDVSVRAGASWLVRDVSIRVAPGEVLGLLGPNGAGKSSLLRTLYRMSRPSTGRVLINGEDVWQRPAAWVGQHVGAVLQDMPADFPLTVRDVVTMGRAAHKALLEPDTQHDAALVEAAIALQRLAPLQDRAVPDPVRRGATARPDGARPGAAATGAGVGRADQPP